MNFSPLVDFGPLVGPTYRLVMSISTENSQDFAEYLRAHHRNGAPLPVLLTKGSAARMRKIFLECNGSTVLSEAEFTIMLQIVSSKNASYQRCLAFNSVGGVLSFDLATAARQCISSSDNATSSDSYLPAGTYTLVVNRLGAPVLTYDFLVVAKASRSAEKRSVSPSRETSDAKHQRVINSSDEFQAFVKRFTDLVMNHSLAFNFAASINLPRSADSFIHPLEDRILLWVDKMLSIEENRRSLFMIQVNQWDDLFRDMRGKSYPIHSSDIARWAVVSFTLHCVNLLIWMDSGDSSSSSDGPGPYMASHRFELYQYYLDPLRFTFGVESVCNAFVASELNEQVLMNIGAEVNRRRLKMNEDQRARVAEIDALLLRLR